MSHLVTGIEKRLCIEFRVIAGNKLTQGCVLLLRLGAELFDQRLCLWPGHGFGKRKAQRLGMDHVESVRQGLFHLFRSRCNPFCQGACGLCRRGRAKHDLRQGEPFGEPCGSIALIARHGGT